MRRLLQREEGFGLTDALASAAVLSLVVLGVYAGLDGTLKLTGQNKSRTVAAALAQQDQERLRSRKASELSNLFSQRTVEVSGVRYTVVSRAIWTSDSSGTESCSSTGRQADYLKISSTVTSPAMQAKPVRLESIVAPPPGGLGGARGNLAVQVVDQRGTPLVGLPVAAAPASITQSTNTSGCAFFGHVPAGAYQATFSRSGFVTPAGAANATLTAAVASGSTSFVSTQYAPAAQIAVSFRTTRENGDSAPAQARNVAVGNPGLPGTGIRIFSSADPSDSITATGLFPFTNGYGVYAGSCAAANPTTYIPSYWSQFPGYVTAGPNARAAVAVRVPAIRMLVMRGSAPVVGGRVIVRATGSGCVDAVSATTDSQGRADVPMPFGRHSVCADNGLRSTAVTVDNVRPEGTTRTTLSIGSGRGSLCA